MVDTLLRRRQWLDWFLGTSVGALVAAVLYPVLRYVSPPKVPEAATHQVEAGLTNDPELLEKGFKILRFGADPVILIRLSETEFRALSATCTHLDCIVEYRRPEQRDLVQLPQRPVRPERPQRGGPAAQAARRPLTVHVVSRGAGPARDHRGLAEPEPWRPWRGPLRPGSSERLLLSPRDRRARRTQDGAASTATWSSTTSAA